ncbi:hypothetical protein [Mucilaginibacter sp. AK015]|uniref:hypothetical protein n=1 Tax=Mucilaginibacter sp. AK015 TaxID=2723072 RepID=UPI001622BE9D|nr:hypothetical protein [Mucilaginibacter sp. AK015]MBB5395856.1 hypothetical protein [Mucilaginibacter sp. AK015]
MKLIFYMRDGKYLSRRIYLLNQLITTDRRDILIKATKKRFKGTVFMSGFVYNV